MKSIKLIVLTLALVSFYSCKAQPTESNVSTQEVNRTSKGKKNILFIAIDDLKPLLSNYGETQMVTPNFDRLAEMGMTFTNAHVQQAVCGPSRASVMTGTYPDRTKVWDLHTDFRDSAPDLLSMPEYLISQGYETTGTGKIYHQGSVASKHDGKSWSIPYTRPFYFNEKFGQPSYSFYQNPETKARQEELTKEGKAKGLKGGKLRSFVLKQLRPSTECIEAPDDAYAAGLYTIEGLKKIDQILKTDKPFFVGVGYQKPHLPFVAPKKYWDLYKREEIKLAKFQQLTEGAPEFAYHSFGELRAHSDIPNDMGVGDLLPEEKQRELIHGYMACISYVDAQIGKLLDGLEERGILEETVIVLWGDHGYHLGDHTLWNKHSNFEEATHIPFMFAGPGVEKNQKSSHPVNLIDLFPTIFDLVDVPAPSQVEGKSLKPLLDNNSKTTVEMDFAISQFPRHGKRMGYSIRTDRFRYTEWHNNGYKGNKPYSKNNVEASELYDYEKDPLETRNLINDPGYKDIVKQHQQKLEGHLTKQYNIKK